MAKSIEIYQQEIASQTWAFIYMDQPSRIRGDLQVGAEGAWARILV